MGAAQSIPVVGEIVTVVDTATRTIAAGVCEVLGDKKDAKELIKGVNDTLQHYTDVNLVVANARVLYYLVRGDKKSVYDVLSKEGEAWTDVGENTPAVGHVIALARFIEGDKDGAKRAVMAASRSALVLAATLATGGLGGGAASAVAATGTGLVADGVMTGLNSLDEHKYAPVGTFSGVSRAIKTKSVNDWVSAAEIPVGDALAGAMEGGVKAAMSHPKPFRMVENASDQIPLETLKANDRTSHFVREFPDPESALKHLAHGGDNSYDFVRLTDGKIRAISHVDRSEAISHLPDQGPVGHSSLVEPGHAVHAAGEIHLKGGVVTNINCQSGHYRVPLKVMARQMGDAFPRNMLTLESIAFARLFGALAGRRTINIPLPGLREILIYSPKLLVFGMTQNKEPATLQKADYAVTFHENNQVKTIGVADKSSAQAIYDDLPDEYSKALISKRESKVLSSHGDTKLIQQCKDQVLGLKSFLVFHGLHLTVPLQDASHIVAFYRKDCIKMVGSPNEEFGRKVYKNVAPGLAKVLVDRRKHEVLESTIGDADSDKLAQCKDHAMKLPALDETTPLEGASWVLIWYQKNSIKAIGFRDANAAEAMYNTISTDYPKVLGERGTSDDSRKDAQLIRKSNGNADRCKGTFSMLKQIHQGVPIENARFVNALHKNDHVKIVGFPKYEAASMFHAAVSPWDRIVFDRRISQTRREHMYSTKERAYVNRCKTRVLQLSALLETEVPCGQYLVVFHQKDHVNMFVMPDESSAQAVYQEIDPGWSRILVNLGQDETITDGTKTDDFTIRKKDGWNPWMQLCEEAVRELVRLRTTVPLQTAQIIVAYRQDTRVRLIGFSKQAAAQDAYDAMSKDTSKVIAQRGKTKPLASNGPATDVKECGDEIRRFFSLEDSVTHKSAIESIERPSLKIDDKFKDGDQPGIDNSDKGLVSDSGDGPNTGDNGDDNQPGVNDNSDDGSGVGEDSNHRPGVDRSDTNGNDLGEDAGGEDAGDSIQDAEKSDSGHDEANRNKDDRSEQDVSNGDEPPSNPNQEDESQGQGDGEDNDGQEDKGSGGQEKGEGQEDNEEQENDDGQEDNNGQEENGGQEVNEGQEDEVNEGIPTTGSDLTEGDGSEVTEDDGNGMSPSGQEEGENTQENNDEHNDEPGGDPGQEGDEAQDNNPGSDEPAGDEEGDQDQNNNEPTNDVNQEGEGGDEGDEVQDNETEYNNEPTDRFDRNEGPNGDEDNEGGSQEDGQQS